MCVCFVLQLSFSASYKYHFKNLTSLQLESMYKRFLQSSLVIFLSYNLRSFLTHFLPYKYSRENSLFFSLLLSHNQEWFDVASFVYALTKFNRTLNRLKPVPEQPGTLLLANHFAWAWLQSTTKIIKKSINIKRHIFCYFFKLLPLNLFRRALLRACLCA